MDDQVQNPPTPTADAIPEEVGSIDAAVRAFEQRETAQAAPADEVEETAEAAAETEDADPNADPDEGQPDEDTEQTAELTSVEFEGKTYEVPPELEKALLRQADYSRKMNDVSEKSKAAEAQLEQAKRYSEGAEKYAEALAETRVLDQRIEQFKTVNWQQLRSENPAEYAALAADLHSLQLTKGHALERVRAVANEVEQAKTETYSAKRAEMIQTLTKTMKGWGDDMGTALTKYARESGINEATLHDLTDPGIVIALEKARKWDAANTKVTALRATAKPVPQVMKPGAPRQTDAKSDSLARLRKSNSSADAEAAFLARMR